MKTLKLETASEAPEVAVWWDRQSIHSESVGPEIFQPEESDALLYPPSGILEEDIGTFVQLHSSEIISQMLAWYRSRDMEKVTLATHWFVSIDIQKCLTDLIEDLRNGNLEEVETAKRSLAAYSELGLKAVMALLDDPELHPVATEILSMMDEYVLPHLLRWVERTDSYNIRIGIYRALTGHLRDPRAKRALADGLRSSDRLEAAFVCQALLESGPKGRRIIEIVFPEGQLQAA